MSARHNGCRATWIWLRQTGIDFSTFFSPCITGVLIGAVAMVGVCCVVWTRLSTAGARYWVVTTEFSRIVEIDSGAIRRQNHSIFSFRREWQSSTRTGNYIYILYSFICTFVIRDNQPKCHQAAPCTHLILCPAIMVPRILLQASLALSMSS